MRLKKDIIVAIDGHASCGKSTLAKKIAQTLHYSYIDTGAMYRAVTLFALENNLITNKRVDNQAVIQKLDEIKIDFIYDETSGKSVTYLNGKNVEAEIRTMRVSEFASPIATIKEVRQKLVAMQQKMGKNKRITMDGRDIGSVVFPDADLKIFLTASPKVRAKRRFDELTAKGEKVNFDEILENVITRDKIDSTRAESPLIQTEDAILIDNSNLNINETYAVAMAIIAEKFGNGINFK